MTDEHVHYFVEYRALDVTIAIRRGWTNFEVTEERAYGVVIWADPPMTPYYRKLGARPMRTTVPSYSSNEREAVDLLRDARRRGAVWHVKLDGLRERGWYTVIDAATGRLTGDVDSFEEAVAKAWLRSGYTGNTLHGTEGNY